MKNKHNIDNITNTIMAKYDVDIDKLINMVLQKERNANRDIVKKYIDLKMPVGVAQFLRRRTSDHRIRVSINYQWLMHMQL